MINKIYRDVKKVLRKNTLLVDTYFLQKYSFSPYMACQHGCKYCDGRAEKYYVEGDFENDIIIRKNLPAILRTELDSCREPGTIFVGSGISDAYQPVEAEEGLMQSALEIINEKDFSVAIMTKSPLIKRDLNLLKNINEKSGVIVMVSLTTLSEEIRKIFEPGAGTIQERLEVLKLFKENGIPVGVSAMPFLPYVTDSENDIEKLFLKLKEIPVDFIFYSCLTLRPGKQKNLFFQVIGERFPQLMEEYKVLYGEERASGAPTFDYRKKLFLAIRKLLQKNEIPSQIPHYIYKGKFPVYDEIYILLNHMLEIYGRKHINVERLKVSLDKYKSWLVGKKGEFNRKRSSNYKDLERDLSETFDTKEMKEILGNDKLFYFIGDIIFKKSTFDYIQCKLIQEKSKFNK